MEENKEVEFSWTTHVFEPDPKSKNKLILKKIQPYRLFQCLGKPDILKQNGVYFDAAGEVLSEEDLEALDFDVEKEVYNHDKGTKEVLDRASDDAVRRYATLRGKSF